MRKYIFFALILLNVISISAQNDADALRFSQYYYGGTARSLSMGGAFGALGGDFGSLSINPAGVGVYRTGEFTITPNMNFKSVTASYLGTKYTSFQDNTALSNLGFVSTFNSNKSEGWISANLALGYNRINDFNGNTFITSNNMTSSLLDNFIQNATGNSPGALDAYYEKLAYDAELIYNPIAAPNTSYTHDMVGTNYGELQEKSIVTTGGIGEYVVAFGANYNNKLYLGASLGIQKLKYDEVKTHTETDVNNNIPYFNSFNFTENFNAHGTGYAFKAGFIYRPVEMLRLGLAVHFPTFYRLNSSFSTDLQSNLDLIKDTLVLSPINLNSYSMTTPWRLIGSVGFLFGRIGMLSMDLERVDYTSMRYENTAENRDVNDAIRKYYKPVLNLRVGGEIKFSAFAVRAGYAYYGSPYAKGYGNDNAFNSNFSTGVGYRGSKFFCDLGYVFGWQQINSFLYEANASAYQANLTNKFSQLMATIGFKF